MTAEVLMLLFGSVISLLLGILTWIGHSLAREMRDMRGVVIDHGQQLASIKTTLEHFERRSDLRLSQ